MRSSNPWMWRSLFDDFNISKLEGSNCLGQQEFSSMFASFVHIVSFFKLVSYINMKLEFYETLVFTVLLNFVMWSSWGPLNFYTMSAIEATCIAKGTIMDLLGTCSQMLRIKNKATQRC
jgi:hypothetical protein